MALEDRCTPQSAPSPPSGSPHSPQNASAYHQDHHHPHHIANTLRLFDQQTVNYTTENQMSLHAQSIKVESDNESNTQQDTIPTVRFSITNILSDKFGKSSYKSKKVQRQERAETLFRPYDLRDTDECEKYSETNEYTEIENQRAIYSESLAESIRLANLFEYRQKCISLANSGLFHNFSASSYPRLHEEISASSRQQQQHQQFKYAQQPPKYVEPSPIKHSSLGSLSSLSKTVSQIGSEKPVLSQQRWNEATPSPSPSLSISPASAVSPPIQQTRLPFSSTKGQQQAAKDGCESSDDTKSETSREAGKADIDPVFPAWIYCTRYSDRPSSGPRYRRPKKEKSADDEKRPRTAFSNEQLARLKREFTENRYLTERRRQNLSAELGLNETQIKIWFQNKRAKIKKTTGEKNPLALQLMAQGLYNHSTVPLTQEEEELEMRMNGKIP